MSLSKSIGAYRDIKTVLDQSLMDEGATLVFDKPSQAIRWRHRAYQFLRLWRESDPRSFPKEKMKDKEGKVYEIATHVKGTSPWDALSISVDEAKVTLRFGPLVGFEYIPNNSDRDASGPVVADFDIGDI